MATKNTLKQGSKGSDVKELQTTLINAGYDVGSSGADGIFGTKTAEAVKAYQKANGLSVDGIVGSQTWGSLSGSSNNNANANVVDTKVADEPTSKYGVGGVSDELMDKGNNNPFVASDKQNELDNRLTEQGKVLEGIANKKDLIDSGTMATINSSFSASQSYRDAMEYTNQLLAKLSSGRTSYTSQVEAMMDKIMNREDFEYDVDSDQLFQQALASAMNSGKTAMQDTIGQASALTGGYGSTYATSAGNQAYNAFIEDAYNNLPEYYQMALQAYQMEGEEMYNQLGMFVDADNREYQRTYDAWSANFANAESMYNKEYGQWQDSVNNAFQSANLQLNEYGTRLDASSKLYDVYANQANTNYQREYQSWADEVAQAQNMINILHGDWQYDTNLQYQKDRDAVADAQWEKSYALEVQKAKSSGSRSRGGNPKTSQFKLTDTEINKCKEIMANGGTTDDVLDYLYAKGNLPSTEEDFAILDTVLGINANGDANGEQSSSVNATLKGFRVKENDNFDVTINNTDYRVENHGKVEDETTINKLNKMGKADGSVFTYNGDAYVKYAGGYFKVGATSIFGVETKGYQSLLDALKK